MDGLYAWITRARGFWLALGVYVVAHFALKLWASPNIGTDDVQAALAAQSWAWGYEPRNPPLPTWLLMGFYSVFGVTTAAHAALRYTLYFALFGFAYLCGRRVLETPGLAELSALSLVLLLMFGWTAHNAFSHTLALAAAQFAALWSYLRLVQRRQIGDYALFGLCAALGLLVKYNFLLFLLPLLMASLFVAPARRALTSWRPLVSALVAASVLAPHALWLLHVDHDFGQTLAATTRVGHVSGYLANVAAGLGNLVVSLGGESAPLWIVAPFLFWPLWRIKAEPAPEHRLLWLVLALSLAAPVLFVVAAQATDIKARYLAPILLQAPLALFAWLDTRSPSPRALKLHTGAAAAMAVLAFVVLAGQALFYNSHCRRCWLEMPIPALSQRLRENGFEAGTIVAAEWHVGGTLRLHFPRAAVLVPSFRETSTPRTHGGCVLVWNARLDGDAPPAPMLDLATERLGHPPPGAPAYADVLMLRSADRFDRFGYWLVPGANGDCRMPSDGADALTR